MVQRESVSGVGMASWVRRNFEDKTIVGRVFCLPAVGLARQYIRAGYFRACALASFPTHSRLSDTMPRAGI